MARFLNLWRLLSLSLQRKGIIIVAMMLIGMIIETLSIGMVLPAIALISQPELASSLPVPGAVISFLGDLSQEQLIAGGLLIFVATFALKTAYLSLLAWRTGEYTSQINTELSNRLFAAYMRQPYTFHLGNNSAQLIRNVSSEVSMFSSGFSSGLLVVTESLIIIGITFLIFLIEPMGSLIIFGLISVAIYIFQRIIRPYTEVWSRNRQYHDGRKFQHLMQGLGGVKELLVLGRDEEFLHNFRFHNDAAAVINQRHSWLQQQPRLCLEFVAVGSIAVIFWAMFSRDVRPEDIVPVLGVFVAAAFRLLPSANRVLGNLQNLRYGFASVDLIVSEFKSLRNLQANRLGETVTFKNRVHASSIVYCYDGARQPSLRGVNLSITRGQVIGIVGTTGAGKSTFIDVLLGLLEPQSGKILADEIDVRTDIRSWQNSVGYVPQSIYLTDDTLRRNVAFGLPDANVSEVAVWRALKAARLDKFVEELPEGLDSIVGERGVRISGGQRQRIGIARALYHDPPLLVLDEATSSLDEATERGVLDSIEGLRKEKTIVIVSHRLSTLESCDYLYRFEDGLIADEGMPKDVISRIAKA